MIKKQISAPRRSPQGQIFIKNPNRGRNEHIVSTTPEYQRLGVDPVDVDKVRKTQGLEAGLPNLHNKRMPKPNSPTNRTPNVVVGMIDNNDEIDTAGLQGQYLADVENSEDSEDQRAEINEDDLDEQQLEDDQYDPEAPLEDDKDLVLPGQYMILIRSKPSFVGTLEDVEAYIEQKIFSKDSNYSENDFIVLKRINLKVGVVVRE
jgi:hypothetical protein